jgi:hypothetical protein
MEPTQSNLNLRSEAADINSEAAANHSEAADIP